MARPGAGRDAAPFEHGDLLQQGLGGQHHAVADEAAHPIAQDARGDQVQDRLVPADDQGVARIVPALEADHGRGPVGEQVHDLALTLIAPLGTDDDYALTHRSCSPT